MIKSAKKQELNPRRMRCSAASFYFRSEKLKKECKTLEYLTPLDVQFDPYCLSGIGVLCEIYTAKYAKGKNEVISQIEIVDAGHILPSKIMDGIRKSQDDGMSQSAILKKTATFIEAKIVLERMESLLEERLL